jgi:hypothetical protein
VSAVDSRHRVDRLCHGEAIIPAGGMRN